MLRYFEVLVVDIHGLTQPTGSVQSLVRFQHHEGAYTWLLQIRPQNYHHHHPTHFFLAQTTSKNLPRLDLESSNHFLFLRFSVSALHSPFSSLFSKQIGRG